MSGEAQFYDADYMGEPVRVAAFARSIGRDVAVIAVEDEGNGMSADDIARAGVRFRRGRAGTGTPGAGLGLAIVKTIAELHLPLAGHRGFP